MSTVQLWYITQMPVKIREDPPLQNLPKSSDSSPTFCKYAFWSENHEYLLNRGEKITNGENLLIDGSLTLILILILFHFLAYKCPRLYP